MHNKVSPNKASRHKTMFQITQGIGVIFILAQLLSIDTMVIHQGKVTLPSYLGKAYNPYYHGSVNTQAIILLAMLLMWVIAFSYLSHCQKEEVESKHTREEEEDLEGVAEDEDFSHIPDEKVLELIAKVYNELKPTDPDCKDWKSGLCGPFINSGVQSECPEIEKLLFTIKGVPSSLAPEYKQNFCKAILKELKIIEREAGYAAKSGYIENQQSYLRMYLRRWLSVRKEVAELEQAAVRLQCSAKEILYPNGRQNRHLPKS